MVKKDYYDVDNPLVISAVILGTIQRTFNKIQPGKYNIYAVDFGINKEDRNSIKKLVSQVDEDSKLLSIYEDAVNGKYTVEDLQKDKNRPQEEQRTMFQALSPYAVDNQEVLANNREFNKIQREGSYLNHLINGLQQNLLSEYESFSRPKYVMVNKNVQFNKTKKEMILCLADWHIGALVYNVDTGGYDFKLLQERLDHLIEETVKTVKAQGVTHIHVYHIGDVIEHINMRNVNQAFEAEFPATEQIAKGIRVISETLNALASLGTKITFGIVGGNHDRFQGNKNDKIHNDNIAYLVIDQLFFLQSLGGLDKAVELIDNRSDVYSFLDTVAKKRVKVVHGDHEAKKTDVKITKHIKDEVINYLIMGHIHTTRIIQEDYARFHVYVGSPMGANNYSNENNLPMTSPSQMIICLDPEVDSPYFQPVFL